MIDHHRALVYRATRLIGANETLGGLRFLDAFYSVNLLLLAVSGIHCSIVVSDLRSFKFYAIFNYVNQKFQNTFSISS